VNEKEGRRREAFGPPFVVRSGRALPGREIGGREPSTVVRRAVVPLLVAARAAERQLVAPELVERAKDSCAPLLSLFDARVAGALRHGVGQRSTFDARLAPRASGRAERPDRAIDGTGRSVPEAERDLDRAPASAFRS
jgi:hypothetical protein